MKNSEYKLKELLEAFAGQSKIHDKLATKRLEEAWHNSYAQFSSYTDKMVFKQEVLTIWINSALLRVELSYNKKKMIQELNQQIGAELVKELIFK